MEQVTETRSSRGYFRSSPSTAFDQYLQDIQKLPLIDDPEEERRLARRAQRGDEKAAERLVTANLRFVISYVKKYQGHGLDLSELVAIGNEGLLKAVKKFDPDQGVKFISYAVWWVRQAVLKALAEQTRSVRIPLNQNSQLIRMSRTETYLSQELGREPTDDEIAMALQDTVENVRTARRMTAAELSLDAPVDRSDKDAATLGERFAGQEGGEIVGPRHVRTALPERVTYAKDGLPTHRRVPGVVVLPGSRDEVIAVVRLLGALGMPFVPRGAGTGLSGGALADGDAVLIVLTRLNRILKIDARNRLAVVEPGVVNVRLSVAAAPHGLQYTPDPSSQTACTIGGNVAENAGGPHCLKYGVTATHVLALEVALADGRVVELGSPGGEPWGPDLVGLFVGSEGNFGVATRITVRLLPVPRAIRTLLADFSALRTAGEAVSAVIASGIVPAALEMMDQSCIQAVEDSVYAAGYPRDAAAVLLAELDGAHEAAVAADAETIQAVLRAHGARSVLVAADAQQREKLWLGRKKAFGAMGRLSRDLVVQDAVVPRSTLPDVLETISRIAAAYGLTVSNVFHAGA